MGAGTVVVKASQSGNSRYAAAADVSQTITVNTKSVTVNASNASRAYGDANPAAPGFTTSGLVGSDAISSVTYTYATTATATANVGTTHSITPGAAIFSSGNAANYSINYTAGTLTITAVPYVTLSFSTNGGSTVASQSVAYSTTVALPTPPVKTGYTFDGWYSDPELTTSFNFSTAITGDTTLYAKWLDVTKPQLAISTLADNSITNNATLNISGTASDNTGLASLTINGASVTVTDSSFSSAVTLSAGANAITVTASDLAGNQTTVSRTITLDSTAPTLTIVSPSDNTKTSQTSVTITGTVSETVTVQVRNNSGTWQAAQMNGTGYSLLLNLVAGLNAIEVTATDTAGNSMATAAKRTVTYDNGAPTLAITSPAQDITTASSTITLAGTVSDTLTAATVTITHNGQTYTPVVTDGTFSQQLTFSTVTTYAITVTATDEAGNTTSVTRNIIYQPNHTVSPSAGTGGSITPSTPQTLSHGATATFTITPDGGYGISSVSGTCGGSLNGTTYTTTAITADCTVIASFSASPVNGACGSSSGTTVTVAPATNLCTIGTASSVSGSGPWSWSCAGSNGGSSASCSASKAAIATKAGDCDGDNVVTIAEVQSAINMFLGLKTVQSCVDTDNSGSVSIAEVQKTINSFLGL